MATNDTPDSLSKFALPDNTASVAPTLVAPSDVASKEAAPDTSFGNFMKLWRDTDSTPNAAARFLVEGKIPTDYDFHIEDMNAQERDELLRGFDQKVVDNLYYTARSREDLYFLADEARRQQQNEAQLAAYGGWGTAGRMVGGVADPGNLLLMVGTGGLGAGAKVAQIGDAVKLATTTRALTPLAEQVASLQSTGTLTRLAYGSTAAAVENGVIQAGLNTNDANHDGTDVALAAFTGFVFHAGVSGMFARGEQRQIQSVVGEYQNRVKLAQLADRVEEQRASLVSTLAGGEAAARAAEGELHGRVGSFLAANNGPTEDYAAFRRTLESGGSATAKSSTSTAVGADQFLEKTWLSTVEQAKPAWAEGLSREEILAQRTNAERSGEMAEFLDNQNASALERSGAPVNAYTMYAAHHFGPQRAIKFAKAADDVLMDEILPEGVLKANPYLRGKTKAEVLANWTDRARRGGVDMDAMLGRSGLADAEGYRTAQVTDFDAEAVTRHLQELDADPARLPQLDFESGTALTQGALRKLERAIDADRADLKGNHGTPTAKLDAAIRDIRQQADGVTSSRTQRLAEAREQDVAVHGKSVDSPAVVKLRERSVDESIRGATRPLKEAIEKLRKQRADGLKTTQKNLDDKLARREMNNVAHASKAEAKRVRSVQRQYTDLKSALGLHEARTQLRGELTSTAPRRETLGQLDNLGTLSEGVAERQAGGTFGADTLSAARAVGYSDELFPNAKGSGEVVPQARLAKWNRLANRGTFAGVLRGSEHEVVRNNFGRLVGNIFGQVDGSATSEGASEISSALQRRWTSHFSAAVEATYSSWMKEQGIPRYRFYNRQIRAEFMSEVGRHVRGQESESVAVQAMAGRVSKLFADVLNEAKRAGVQGFDNVEVNANYLPRVFDYGRLGQLEERFGSDQLSRLIAEGMKETNPELSDEIALKAGAHYVQKMREMRIGNDPGVLAGMSFDDIGYLRQFLREAGVPDDELEATVARFAEVKLGDRNAKGEGSFRNAKRRAKFDENFALDLRVRGGAGETERVRISDLLDNNVEGLVGRYVRTVSGHTALAHIGIKSAADWADRVKAVKNGLEGEADAETILKKAQAAYDIVSGRPLEEATIMSELMRTTRDITYATQMENAGLANLPDLGALLAKGNLRYTFSHLMNLREMFPRGSDGRLRSELWREQEEWLGVGTDYLNNTVFSSYDVAGAYQGDASAALGRSLLQRAAAVGGTVSHAARVTGRAVTVGSGMATLNAFSQRAAAMNILLRLKDDLFGRGAFNPTRMAALGIDAEIGERIASQMKKHTEWAEGELGGRIRKVNWAEWTDLEARDRLMNAVHREAKKNIQEEDLGDTFLWQHKNLGKFLTQFRRFTTTAYTKQFLRSLNERDAETVTRNALQVLLAGAAFYAKTEAQREGMELAGVDQDKIDKWAERNAGWGPTSRAAVRNAGFMFLLPDVYDATVGRATGEPLFDYRNSGNSSGGGGDLGIPGVALVNSVGTAAAGVSQAILRGDRQYKQRDLRALQSIVPFGNHLAVAPLFQALSQELPETDEDDDPDHAKWAWE